MNVLHHYHLYKSYGYEENNHFQLFGTSVGKPFIRNYAKRIRMGECSSSVIVLTSIFMLLIGILPLKDGFKASLYVIYPALGFIEFMLSAFSPDRIKDNWAMIALILLVAFQIIFLFITNIISNKIK